VIDIQSLNFDFPTHLSQSEDNWWELLQTVPETKGGAPTLAPLQARGCPDENDFSTPRAGRASMRCPSGRNFHVS